MNAPVRKVGTSPILDARGIPFRSARPTGTFTTLGVGGTAIYGGFIQENEKNPLLARGNKYKLYSNMLANVSIVAAGIRMFLNLTAKAGWKVNPADDTPAAVELAEFVEETMGDMTTPWRRIVRRSAMFKFYGFSIQEWTARRREDGRIVYKDIEPRPQKTIEQWFCDESGTVVGVFQRSPQTSELIPLPRGKLVYLVDDSLDDSPEGLGLFRHLVEPSSRLDNMLQLEVFGFEGDLRGIPVGRVPYVELDRMVTNGDISEKKAKELAKVMEDFIQNHKKSPALGIVLDSMTYQTEDEKAAASPQRMWDIEQMKEGNATQESVAMAIERLNREIARVLGVEFLLLGGSAVGSLALSKDKTSNFKLLIDSGLSEIADTYEADYLDPLWAMNGFDPDLKPEFVPDQIKFEDVTEMSTVLRDLATAGSPLTAEDPAVDVVRELLGLPPQPTLEQRMALFEMVGDMALGGGVPGQPSTGNDPDDPEADDDPGGDDPTSSEPDGDD